MRWPTTKVGAEEYYGIDLSSYLRKEGDDLVGLTWTLPNGLESLHEVTDGTTCLIKIGAIYRGKYKIQAQVDTIDSLGQVQTQTTFAEIDFDVVR